MFHARFSVFNFQRGAARGAWRPVVGIAAILVTVLPALLVGAATTQTAAGVRDVGNFFSPGAISRANDIIYDIHLRFGKDLLVETFPTVPDDRKTQYDPQNKAQFFSQWAHQRFTQEKMDGIYILVCRDPSYFQVHVGDQTADVFRPANQDEMHQALLNAFRERNFDQGLTDAAEYVRSTLTRNMAALSQPAQVPNSSHGLGCFGIALMLAAGFVVLRLLVTVLGRGPSGPGPVGPGTVGPGLGGGFGSFGYGGGFGRGMLGGLFGGLAGNWLYDRMFRGPGDYYEQSGGPSGGDFGGTQGPSVGNDQGQGMDAGGGDFSAPSDAGSTGVSDSFGATDSGGTDPGSTDSASTDSGGGDFGGGDGGGDGGGSGDSGGSF